MAAAIPRPLFNVGENYVHVLGSYTPRRLAGIQVLADETARASVDEAISRFLADKDYNEPYANKRGASMRRFQDESTVGKKNIPTERRNTKRSSPKPSAARLRARKYGERKRQREKWAKANAVEAEAFRKDMARREAEEKRARGELHNKKGSSKPNPFVEYFGFDVRKAYPYGKYRTHIKRVETLAGVEAEITAMQQECAALKHKFETTRMFTGDTFRSRRSKDYTDEATNQVARMRKTRLTNNRSSKLLFGGTMDGAAFESEWHQAWESGNEGLSIWDAVRLGDIPRVKELLEKSRKYRERVARHRRRQLPPPPMERDYLNARGVDGQTPLHLVVMLRDNDLHDEIFDLLMEHGADVAAQTIEGYTPLHYCVATPRPNMDMMVRMLDVADKQWENRLEERKREESGTCELDPDILIRRASMMSVDNHIMGADVDLQEMSTYDPENGNDAKGTKWRCTRCNHMNEASNRGACSACKVVPAKWFLSLERHNHRPLDMTTVYGETCTSMAIKAGLRDRVAILLKYGPNLNRPDDQGCTMLMYAVKRNRLDLIRMVLAYGADVNAANYHGETALTFARDLALENDDDIVMMLTDAAGDFEWKRLRLGWMIPESELQVSEQTQFEHRRMERMWGSKGSKVRKTSRAKSRRRRNGAGLKYDLDYGPFFGDGVGAGEVVKTETDADIASKFFTRASRS